MQLRGPHSLLTSIAALKVSLLDRDYTLPFHNAIQVSGDLYGPQRAQRFEVR